MFLYGLEIKEFDQDDDPGPQSPQTVYPTHRYADGFLENTQSQSDTTSAASDQSELRLDVAIRQKFKDETERLKSFFICKRYLCVEPTHYFRDIKQSISERLEQIQYMTVEWSQNELQKLKHDLQILLLILKLSMLLVVCGPLNSILDVKVISVLTCWFYKAIRLILWTCGDIETNPGPPRSPDEIAFMRELIPILVKIINGLPPKSYVKDLYTKLRPPQFEGLLLDPNNQKKENNITTEALEKMFRDLCKYCDDHSIVIPERFKREINAFESGDVEKLTDLRFIRIQKDQILERLQKLIDFKPDGVITAMEILNEGYDLVTDAQKRKVVLQHDSKTNGKKRKRRTRMDDSQTKKTKRKGNMDVGHNSNEAEKSTPANQRLQEAQSSSFTPQPKNNKDRAHDVVGNDSTLPETTPHSHKTSFDSSGPRDPSTDNQSDNKSNPESLQCLQAEEIDLNLCDFLAEDLYPNLPDFLNDILETDLNLMQ